RELPFDVLAHAGRHRWAQVELREGGTQVEPRASDDDRPPALVEQRVDLGVGSLGVAAGAELLARLDYREQAGLGAGGALAARGAAQRLQATVDLDRVAVDGNGVLAPGSKRLRDCDRDAGLPHPRRAEDRQDPHRAWRPATPCGSGAARSRSGWSRSRRRS